MLKPQEGGCWYCGKLDDKLVLCWEFDTNVHIECIKDRLKKDPNDIEAKIMWEELGVTC